MISIAPHQVQLDFQKELSYIVEGQKLSSMYRYYKLLRQKRINEPHNPFEYENIDDRVNTSRYFYFPTEAKTYQLNCFEKSAALYFGFIEAYPESNPSLLYVNEGERGIHSIVAWMHNHQLWGACPTYGFFSRIDIRNKDIVIHNEEPRNRREKKAYWDNETGKHKKRPGPMPKRRISIKGITKVDDKTLQIFADSLRKEYGIVNFLNQVGQTTAFINEGFISNYTFSKIVDGRIQNEVRIDQLCESKENVCIRITTDPVTGNTEYKFVSGKAFDYSRIIDERSEEVTEAPYSFEDTQKHHSYAMQLKDIAYFMTRKTIPIDISDFISNPIVAARFEKAFSDAEKLGAYTKDQIGAYIQHRFGSPEQIAALDERPLEILSGFSSVSKDGKTIDIPEEDQNEIGEAIASIRKLDHDVWIDMEIRNANYIFALAHDARRYTQEAIKHMRLD